jgi:rod shape-determining protein MreD
MLMTRDKIATIVLAAVCLLLQIIVAPYISIGSIVPNFLFACTSVLACARAARPNYVLAFALGLVYDLLGSGVVGSMALLCVLTCVAISLVMRILDADTFIVPVVLCVACAFVANIIYGVVTVGATSDIGLFEALVSRSLPCGLYDSIIGLVLMPVALKFCRAEVF